MKREGKQQIGERPPGFGLCLQQTVSSLFLTEKIKTYREDQIKGIEAHKNMEKI